MATYYAIGGTSADLSTLANWKPNRDGSGSSPASFDATDTYIIEQAPSSSPTSPWTGNLNDEVLAFIITYGGAIGEAGNPLRFAVAGVLRVNRSGSADQYLAPVGTGSNQVWIKARVEQTGRGKMIFNHSSAVQCDDLSVSPGCNVELGSNFQMKATTGVVRTSIGSNVYEAGASTVPLSKYAGQVTSTRPHTTMDVESGGAVKTIGTGGAITTATVRSGGSLLHHAAGTIGTSEVLPGGKATAFGSPYKPTVNNRVVWDGGKNFDDNSAVLQDASDDVVSAPGR